MASSGSAPPLLAVGSDFDERIEGPEFVGGAPVVGDGLGDLIGIGITVGQRQADLSLD